MASFESSPATALWEATAVSNAFLCEYMPTAPENHLKVYLYGLMSAHSGLSDGGGLIADAQQALELSEEEILSALRYWERCRLVEHVSDNPPVYRFVNPAKVLFDRMQMPDDEAYERFAQSVHQLFDGKTRKIHGGDTQLAYEWVEQLKLSPEIVLMLLQFMMTTHGQNFKFSAAGKIAIELKEQKISSVEEAEAFFAGQERQYKGAKKVLKTLAIRRDPTDPELALYQKWTLDWGFEQEAILQACSGTTAAATPTFAYLDKILENLRAQSSTDTAAAAKTLAEDKREVELIREVLSELGVSQDRIGDGEKIIYRELSVNGHELVLFAAKQVKSHGKVFTLGKVGELLSKWAEKGITTPKNAKMYVEEVEGLNRRLMKLNESFRSHSVKPSEGNRAFLRRWLIEWGMEDALIALSAGFAANASDPLRYMDTLLSRWHEKGITDTSAAQREHADYLAAHPVSQAQTPKKVNAQLYNQRDTDLSGYEDLTPEEIEEIKQYAKQRND